jgi:uncharacterized phage protein gp47/JayE
MPFQLKNFNQIVASLVNWLAANQTTITDFNQGSVARTLCEAFGSELNEVYFRIFKGLDDAQAAGIYNSFDFPKKSATSATGTVLLQRSALPTSPIVISSGTQVAVPAIGGNTQITFTTASTYTIPNQTTLDASGIASSGTLTFNVTASTNMGVGDVLLCDSEKLKITGVAGVAITVLRGYQGTTAVAHAANAPIGVVQKAVVVNADLAGSAGNVAAATISVITTNIAGLTTVTNEAALTGGTDAETDDQRKKRFNEFISGIARGTKAAIQFGAKQVPNVVSAVCIDNEDDGTILPGYATVYVADASGNADSTTLANVVTQTDLWRPAGLVLTVAAPTQVPVAITATIKLAAGFDPTLTKAAITTNITNFITALKMGDPLYMAKLIQTMIDTSPTSILNVTLAAPVADTTVTPSQIIRPGTITLTTIS